MRCIFKSGKIGCLAPGILIVLVEAATSFAGDGRLPAPDPGWRLVVGEADYDGDGHADLLWHRNDNSGEPRVWLMDGLKKRQDVGLPLPDPGWRLIGMADFDGDGKADLVWHRANGTGEPRVWLMSGFAKQEDLALPSPDPGWRLAGVGDFNGDGHADLLWHRNDNSGEPRVWLMDGLKKKEDLPLRSPDPGWWLVGSTDVDHDAKTDMLWRRANDTGVTRAWLMDGLTVNKDVPLLEQPLSGIELASACSPHLVMSKLPHWLCMSPQSCIGKALFSSSRIGCDPPSYESNNKCDRERGGCRGPNCQGPPGGCRGRDCQGSLGRPSSR